MTAWVLRSGWCVSAWLRSVVRGVSVGLVLAAALPAHAQDVRFERVAEGVYAHIGDTGAQRIQDAVRRVTPLPVKWVINTGGQDHRWLGNGWFQAQGAQLIAHAQGEADMRNRGNDHLEGLRAALGGVEEDLLERGVAAQTLELRQDLVTRAEEEPLSQVQELPGARPGRQGWHRPRHHEPLQSVRDAA